MAFSCHFRAEPVSTSSRRPIKPDISRMARGPLKVAKKDQNFVIEYNHDEEPEEPQRPMPTREIFSTGGDKEEFTFYDNEEEILIDDHFVQIE